MGQEVAVPHQQFDPWSREILLPHGHSGLPLPSGEMKWFQPNRTLPLKLLVANQPNKSVFIEF